MLDERKRLILNAVVQDYICSAEPVGSRTLVKRHRIGLSPATIRNEMADLEEMGFLEQPHTSAGRIPSHRGYRFYVNSLMKDFQFDPAELQVLEQKLSDLENQPVNFTRQLAKLLSSVTSYISLISKPCDTAQEIRHIDIIPLTVGIASLIVVLSDGAVNHTTIGIPAGLNGRQIRSLTNFINSRLQGIKLMDINQSLLKELREEFSGNMKLINDIMEFVQYMLLTQDEQLIVDGAKNLLSQPEFKDINKFQELLATLEQNDVLLKLMQVKDSPGDLEIRIGAEIGLESFYDCSLVVATFTLRERKVVLGILGPARMQYAKTISFLRRLRDYFE